MRPVLEDAPLAEQARDRLARIRAHSGPERDAVAALDGGDRVELDARERTDRLLDLAACSGARACCVALGGDCDATKCGKRDRAHAEFLPVQARYGSAVPDWDAEVVLDESLVRALLGEQFPDLDATSARLLDEGWDNAVWVVEERWAFRFPRRAVAIPGVERELEVLPRLAPLFSVPIPVPTFVGHRSERFPWPFFGTRLLPGDEVANAELDDEARVALGIRARSVPSSVAFARAARSGRSG